jgi:tRNA threonylcarbamoyladenosine biosynthesis protein TsaB
MLVLGIDSATSVATAALADTKEVIAELFYNTKKNHSQRLMPMIDSILQDTGISLEDIEGFSVSIGPGSFTGLRIGLSTIKGLAHVLQKPLVGISTLDALANNLKGSCGLICPILNARKNEVYTALYDGVTMNLLTEYLAVSPDKIIKIIEKKGEMVTILGDGVEIFKDLFIDRLGEQIKFALPNNNLPRAGQIACLGAKKLIKGQNDSLDLLKPFYIRKSEAEVRLERNLCGGEKSDGAGNRA